MVPRQRQRHREGQGEAHTPLTAWSQSWQLSLLPMSHWPNQVHWLNPKLKTEKIHSASNENSKGIHTAGSQTQQGVRYWGQPFSLLYRCQKPHESACGHRSRNSRLHIGEAQFPELRRPRPIFHLNFALESHHV